MNIPVGVTRAIARRSLLVKKNSPHIFFVGGVVGVAASTVLACRATLKLEPILDEIRIDVEKVKVTEKVSSEEERSRVMALVYFKGALKVGRLYAPPVVLGAASVALLTGSHVQMTRRNSALSATLALVSQAYDDYRDRVREELGEEKELDIYRAVEKQDEIVDGKKKKTELVHPNKHSPYARVFDETSFCWEKNAELNRIFLQVQQNYVNHLLHANGHVFLNEVYDLLGMPRSVAGAIVGWVRDGNGDNYIDFNMFDVPSSRFINGEERSIWLDFNVDGVIYELIEG